MALCCLGRAYSPSPPDWATTACNWPTSASINRQARRTRISVARARLRRIGPPYTPSRGALRPVPTFPFSPLLSAHAGATIAIMLPVAEAQR
jgi:hypothetical protein